MLSGFAKNRKFCDVVDVIEAVPEKNVVTYNAILSGYLGIGDFMSAHKMFDEMGTTAEQVTGSNLTANVTDSSAISICSVNTKQQADIVAFHLQGIDTHSLPRSFPIERKLEQDNLGFPKKDRVVTNSLASISCRTDLNSHGDC
ncbi:hypothetical protein BC332_03586 [Capsicum chinense]|nr:hypothetical protein BC332_03586 [Capsicum chinense]